MKRSDLYRYSLGIGVFLVVPLGLFINRPAQASCDEPISNNVLQWTIDKINNSEIVELIVLSCDQTNELNKVPGDKLQITTGRKRGRAIICISDEEAFPCKYKLATINSGYDAPTALTKVFSFTPPESSQLNETVERLFLKPSTLIQ